MKFKSACLVAVALALTLCLSLTGCAGQVKPDGAAGAPTVTMPLPLPAAFGVTITHDVTALCAGINYASIAISFADVLVPAKTMAPIDADFADVRAFADPICSGDTTSVTEDAFQGLIAVKARADAAAATASKAKAAALAPPAKK